MGYLSRPTLDLESRGISAHVRPIPTSGTGKFKNEPAVSPSRRLSLPTLARIHQVRGDPFRYAPGVDTLLKVPQLASS
jgi:hypothetical protein